MTTIAPTYSAHSTRSIDPTFIWFSILQFQRHQANKLPAPPGTRSAAVTIIIRFTIDGIPVNLGMLRSNGELIDDIGLVSAVLHEKSKLEVFFIKRSINPRDRWSGHVALPGGRQEKNEDLRLTSLRETMEEVGLNLENEDCYHYLGTLDDRYTMPINIRPFLISTHVYLQIQEPPRAPVLDPSEVAAARWVSLEAFHNALITPVSYPMSLIPNLRSQWRFNVGSMHFPGIILPQGQDIFLPGQSETEYTYHLWGITLDIIEDFCVHMGVCTRGSISYLPRSWNPIVRLYVMHQLYVPHSLKGFPILGGLILLMSVFSAFFYYGWKGD